MAHPVGENSKPICSVCESDLHVRVRIGRISYGCDSCQVVDVTVEMECLKCDKVLYLKEFLGA